MSKIFAEEIADDLGYSVRHIKERVTKSPSFPRAFKVGNRRWWVRDEYSKWLSKQREN